MKYKPCPICGEEPQLMYACGDHFMWCSDGCKSPICDHASDEGTINHWNGWCDNYLFMHSLIDEVESFMNFRD